ncbi:hypothetical protein FACS189454_08210 [Planctomycetales bacterium]|nr:hypothetical protein FACS189454_08210 [Planctomycetales bacterium]
MTGISRRGLLDVIESLISAGLVIQDTNFNIKTYRYAGSTVPVMRSTVPAVRTVLPTMETVLPTTGEKQPTTLTFVNKTEPNLTNGKFEKEILSISTIDEPLVQTSKKRSHFALAAIAPKPAEKSDYHFSI